eukprot:373612_1
MATEQAKIPTNDDSKRSYGSWPSPLTSSSIAGACISIKYLNVNKSNLYWIESRPVEKGRNVIVTRSNPHAEQKDNDHIDITPQQLNSANNVHEYGGNPFIVLQDATVLTSNWDDGRLYIIKSDGSHTPITNEYADGTWRYCDMNQNASNPNHIYAVREQHMTQYKPSDVVNCLVCIDMKTSQQTVVACGNTFYSYPRVDYTGRYLAYVTWNHPNMPWDNTMLCVATLNQITGEITSQQMIDSASSIMQPKWS